MHNVIPLEPPEPPTLAEPPRRLAIRRRSAMLAAALNLALVLTAAFAVLAIGAALFYDGPLMSFGPGGLWFGRAPDLAAGRVALNTFSFAQRGVGALAVVLLIAPILVVLFHARGLFRLYADGIVFAPANARRIKLLAAGLVAYSAAPFVANRVILLAGVTNDPTWFHFDEVLSLVFGALAYVVADVMEFGHEIEQERDGFI